MNIVPIILAGGSGTRLWPLSRESYPKQFLKLVGRHSLLQETILRLKSLPITCNPIVVCNEAHYCICQDQLEEIGLTHVNFILEPVGRNTAPAIAIAAYYVKAHDTDYPSPHLLVLPSDHLITDMSLFLQAVTQAQTAVEKQYLVTFGIKPTAPKTGYGYIEAGESFIDSVCSVRRFIEKPKLEVAQQLIQQDHCYWNSGIFFFRTEVYLSELQRFSPLLFNTTLRAYQSAEKKDHTVRVDRALFSQCPSNSIDYAVMEKTHKAAVVALNAAWNDLGCWASVAEANESDATGNVSSGNVMAHDNHNCYFSSDGRLIAALGLKNQIVVSTADAVLVADKTFSQDVKSLVEQLKHNQSGLTTHHPLVYRPWGYYEILSSGPQFKVKRIMVKPGAKLSLQLHHHRAEHWVVVSGAADVVNGTEYLSLRENQSAYIPQHTKHRLSNSQQEPLIIIEVQSGDYLGEDDIVRLEDVYDRG